MSRRHLSYAVLFVASVVVSACASATAPKHDYYTCPSGVVIFVSSGETPNCE